MRSKKVGVVMACRNEEQNIGRTLEGLKNQTLLPVEIIVVNDGSTDRTGEIARSFGCKVVDLPDVGYMKTGTPEHAKTLNTGLKLLSESLDYVMILGADHRLPPNYIEEIVSRMEMDSRLIIVSGVIKGERTYEEHARGSGRIVKTDFWNKFDLRYPENWGWEPWLEYKAMQLGYSSKSFNDLITEARPTRITPRKMLGWGKAMKALGYNWVYALGRCILMFLKKPTLGILMLRGYLSRDVKKLDVAEWVDQHQRNLFWRRTKEILKHFKQSIR